MSDEYHYTKLATASTIRVIKLEEQKINDTISCVIRHIERSDVEYHALSYVWGDPAPTRKIYLGNCGDQKSIFPLHENLWRFIDWAWNRQMFDRWIWTDRISLNQEDNTEISQQVPRMGETFENARLVMAWLGMSKKEGEQIMPILSMQSFNHREIARSLKMWNQLSPETKNSALTAYYNEYWQRLWIVQEVAMARSLVILIGDIEVPMDDYVSKLRIAQMEISRKFPWGVEGPASFKSGNEKLELWRVLILLSHGNYKCKETNDRVYGGLGLVASRPDGSSPLDFIEVDYSKQFAEVLLDTLLESQPPFEKVPNMADLLLPGQYRSVSVSLFHLFKRYLNSPKTSVRHKSLAEDLLQVCDAFNIMFKTLNSGPGCWAFCNLFSDFSRSNDEFKASIRDSAAILGLAFALGVHWRFNKPVPGPGDHQKNAAAVFKNWRRVRRTCASARSPWRCATHQAHEGYSRALKTTEKGQQTERLREAIYSKVESFCLPSRRLVEACGRYSPDSPQSCNAKTMAFEMPKVGFRIVLKELYDDLRSRPLEKSAHTLCRYCKDDWNEIMPEEGYGMKEVFDDDELEDRISRDEREVPFNGEMILEFLDTEMHRKGLEDLSTW